MLQYALWDTLLRGGLRHSKIIELIDHGNVEIDRAWLAMTAVGALSGIGMKRCR